jgi:lipid II:glycine glycyltransferase (peptidoglycan interpeptide bridge formation enzyme)
VIDLVTKFTNRSDLHQSPMYAGLMKEIGWNVAGKLHSQLFYRTLGPISIAKIQRPKILDIAWLTNFRKKHKAVTTYIEPGLATKLPPNRLGIHVEPFAHSCTSLIDINQDEQAILNSFSQKTRYNIVHTLKKGEVNVVSTKLGHLTQKQKIDFFSLHEEWSQKKDVIGYPLSLLNAVLKSFADSGYLHGCYIGNDLIASLLTLHHDSVATYYAAFATPLGYKSFAPTLLTWAAIQTAKSNNCDIFDFGGIYDPRYPKMYKKWQGFTKFKAGFNPTVVSYPPTSLQLFW